MWTDPLLVQRFKRRAEIDQREGGDGGEPSDLSRCLCAPSVHLAGRRLLRVARRTWRKAASPFGIAGIWEDYCDRIIGLRQGVIVFDRLPSELSESLNREIYCSEENGDEEVELHSTRNRPVPGSQPDRADASPASARPRA